MRFNNSPDSLYYSAENQLGNDAMQSMKEQQATRQVARDELVERIARALPADGALDLPNGLRLRRTSLPTVVGYGVSEPSFCVIAQGAKEIRLGDVHYRYDAEHFLIASAELPIASRIVEASPECPYLGVVLTLDPVLIGSVMVEAGQP